MKRAKSREKNLLAYSKNAEEGDRFLMIFSSAYTRISSSQKGINSNLGYPVFPAMRLNKALS